MQMNALETFLAVEKTGSFHAAAAFLNVTQTTVSARIKVLEENLGQQLFERGPGGTRLSAAGRQFRPYAEQMVRTWQFVKSGSPGMLGERYSLRLGAQLSIWDALLVDVAVWLEQQAGKIPFTLNYDHALNMGEAVAQHVLDVALVNEAPVGTRLQVVDLPAEELVLISDAPLTLSQPDLPLFINLEFGAEYDLQLQQVIPSRNRQHIVLGNAQMGVRYLMQRGGMGYFPRLMIADALSAGRLHEVQEAPVMHLTCKAIYHPDNHALPQISDAIRGLQVLRAGLAGRQEPPRETADQAAVSSS